MNKKRREAINALIGRIEELGATLADLQSEIETIRDEEQEFFDNMPESFQNGDKGSTIPRRHRHDMEASDQSPLLGHA
jgi:uncharacterized coiled-coil DUF342 family protein